MEGSVSKAEWIQSRVNDHTEEIIAFLNPLELLPYLDKHGLVSHDDKEVLLNDRITRRKKVLCILKALENKGTCSAYTDFLECLTEEIHRKEGIHIGHEYLLAFLKGFGEQYATVEECKISKACRGKVIKHRIDIRDLDLPSLVPVMFACDLVTQDEQDMLLDPSKTSIKKIEQLLLILETKGPLAYTIFAQCLGNETSHPTHAQLHEKITHGHSSHESVTVLLRKRKLAAAVEDTDRDGLGVVRVSKRRPEIIHMEEPLSGEVYLKMMATFRACYRSASWEQTEMIADEYINTSQETNPQLKAAVLIEKGYSFSCRGQSERAISCLDQAWAIADQIPGNNRSFLLARCKHIKATMYRYAEEEDRSLEASAGASELLFNCERGDDASRVKYGEACARLEKLGH